MAASAAVHGGKGEAEISQPPYFPAASIPSLQYPGLPIFGLWTNLTSFPGMVAERRKLPEQFGVVGRRDVGVREKIQPSLRSSSPKMT